MADETQHADEEKAEEMDIEDMDVPSEEAEDVKGGVVSAREAPN